MLSRVVSRNLRLFPNHARCSRFSTLSTQPKRSVASWAIGAAVVAGGVVLVTARMASADGAAPPAAASAASASPSASAPAAPQPFQTGKRQPVPQFSEAQLNAMPIMDRFENYLLTLQNSICDQAELSEHDSNSSVRFTEEAYRAGNRMGVARIMQDGKVFEKAAVLVTTARGRVLPPEAINHLLADHPQLTKYTKRPSSWWPWSWFSSSPPEAVLSTGAISLIMHPRNPYAPTIHMNLRYFEIRDLPAGKPVPQNLDELPVGAWWFGGGTDLTPHYLFEEDAKQFHTVLKNACDSVDSSKYPLIKRWCDDYFFIRHRKEARGIGGVFFDNWYDAPVAQLERFVRAVGDCFNASYFPIVSMRKNTPYGPEQRRWQELRHGRYVEFNLLYDKGTKYGLQTPNVPVERILASLPLTVRYEYNFKPTPGSPEDIMQQVVLNPRDWIPFAGSLPDNKTFPAGTARALQAGSADKH